MPDHSFSLLGAPKITNAGSVPVFVARDSLGDAEPVTLPVGESVMLGMDMASGPDKTVISTFREGVHSLGAGFSGGASDYAEAIASFCAGWNALAEALLHSGEPMESFCLTSGKAIETTQHPTSPSTPKGLTRTAMDGERLGRMAWTPGA